MQTEEEIISRIVNGDVMAFKILVKQYEKLVIYMVGRLIQNREDVEDVVRVIRG